MAHPKRGWPNKALTAAHVRNAKPGKHYDGHGLYLRVEESGARRWVQRLIIRGKTREIGLGSASLVTLAEAREKALANRKLARAGGDPLQAKREAESVLTFEEAAKEVQRNHAPTWRHPKSAAIFMSNFETYVFPYFGRMRVSEVTQADVLAALTPIWTSKPETARRTRQRIGTVMKWAIAKGWRKDNPAETIRMALPKQTKRPERRKALPYTEVANCLAAVHASGAWAATKLALEFLVLTASRSSEVRLATWDEIELDKREWQIPANRIKMGRAHRVPLSGRAMEILADAEALRDDSGLVFPSLRGKALSDMTLSKLIKDLGFDADVHGFRTSFRTWAQEMTNFPREVAEAALAHAVGDAVEQAYARSDVFQKRRRMMDAWANYLRAEKGKVVRMETAS